MKVLNFIPPPSRMPSGFVLWMKGIFKSFFGGSVSCEKVGGFIKKHWLVLALAILVSIVYGSHHFFISRQLARQGLEYYPVTIAGNRDEGVMYGLRANAVFQGQLIAGDISIAGNEKSPSALPMLNPIILGGLGRLAGSLKSGFIISDFLFPALIFVALYFLAKELTGRRLAAVLFAVVFVFMPKIFLALPPVSPAIFQAFIDAVAPDAQDLAYFSRFEYPKITFLFFVLAFYLVFRALKRQEKYSVLWAGVAFGVLFYTYLYDWVYFLIGLALMSVIFLCCKDYRQVKRLLAIIAIGLAISLPYWINFFQLTALPHYHDLANRLGSELGRNWRWATAWKTYFRSAALMVLVWLAWRRRDRTVTNFLLGLLPAIIVVLNLQVVLGFNPQPDHWHRVQFLAVGLGFLALGHWLYERYGITDSGRRLFKIVAGGLLVLIFSSALYSQYVFSAAQASRFTVPQEQALSYQWLNKNTPPGSVVGSLTATNSALPLYAHNKLFAPNGFNTTISDAEIWDRFMIMARIFGITAQEFKDLIKQSDIVLYLFHDEYRDRSFDSYFGTSGHELPAAASVKAERQYAEYLEQPAGDLAGKYKLDYLYFSAGTIGADPIRIIPALGKIYDHNGIKIYELGFNLKK